MKLAKILGGLTLAMLSSTSAFASGRDLTYDGGATLLTGSAFDGASLASSAPAPALNGAVGSAIIKSFAGVSQYDVASVKRNFIPPDTMGAVGTTQYVSIVNGGVGIYSKMDGSRQSFVSDTAFWEAAGQVGTNGDPRIAYNATAGRWIASTFGANTSDIQIAVSNTSDAGGTWQSVKFTAYAGAGFGGAIADYTTLALDRNAVYLGSNDYARGSAAANAPIAFQGTTLSVVPLASVFGAGAPTVAGLKQFFTPYDPTSSTNDFTRGFAIQGVNSNANTTTGAVVSASINDAALTSYQILNAGTAGATLTAGDHLIGATYDGNNPGRQPSGFDRKPSQVIDTSDDRVGASVYEANGRIYSVHTVTEPGSNFTEIRYDVIDAVTGAVLDEGNIGNGGSDYYYGSIAVNATGQVVIGYDRSGYGHDGNITFAARTFDTSTTGTLLQTSGELVIKVSSINDYHNGSTEFVAPAGRQRFGDYSSVTVDPNDPSKFWATNQIALEYNTAANGHPGGSGASRWGTWIAEIQADAVPEPATWAMMIAGFGMVGAVGRRRRVRGKADLAV